MTPPLGVDAASTPTGLPPPPPTIPATDLVASLPAPILRLLVLFGHPIALFRAALEVLSWKSGRRVESWLVVGLWWSLCLGSSHAFSWLLPPLVFLPLIPLSSLRLGSRTPPAPTPSHPSTTSTLLRTLSDLHTIHALLPPSPIPTVSSVYARFRQLGIRRLVRGLVVIWLVWLALVHILGSRALLALAGTTLLVLPSPTLAHLVDLLGKSLAVRRTVALVFLFTFGSPPGQDYRLGSPLGWMRSKWAASRRPSLALAFDVSAKRTEKDDEAIGDKAGNPIYFRFEVHENQRWWMGLDWTSALLPQERPSWCDSHLLPVSPPPSFTLPPPSSIDLPAPTATQPRAQVRRTATWRWLDDDWSIVRTGQGAVAAAAATAAVSVPSPNPSDDTESAPTFTPSERTRPVSGVFGTSPEDSGHTRAPSMAEQAFTKGLERLKARAIVTNIPGIPNIPGNSPAPTPSPSKMMMSESAAAAAARRGRTGSQASEDVLFDDTATLATVASSSGTAPIAESDDATDPDGWVYGDNKWENMGARGGLGKFTRRRRWHRRAVCTETVKRITELAPLDPDVDLATLTTTASTSTTTPALERRTASLSPTRPFKTSASLEVAGATAAATIAPRPGTDIRGTSPPPSPAPSSIVPPASATRDEVLRQRLKKVMGNVGG